MEGSVERMSADLKYDHRFIPPDAFCTDPFDYFETHGINIKTGEVQHDDAGIIRENPTATKDLPSWSMEDGTMVEIVGKLVNTEKAEIKKTGNPLHEFAVLSHIHRLGLPGALPIARATNGEQHLLITEKVPGIRIVNTDALVQQLQQQFGRTEEQIESLKEQAAAKMSELERMFETAGIQRTWKLKDMIVQVDFDSNTVTDVIPVDWERTKILSSPEER